LILEVLKQAPNSSPRTMVVIAVRDGDDGPEVSYTWRSPEYLKECEEQGAGAADGEVYYPEDGIPFVQALEQQIRRRSLLNMRRL